MGDGDAGFINGTWVSLFSGNSSAGTARVSFASDPSGFVSGFGAGTDGNGANWQSGATSLTPVGGGGPVTATASVTLANATMSASGTTTSTTTSTIAVTLSNAVMAAAANPVVAALLAVTLADAVMAATGTGFAVPITPQPGPLQRHIEPSAVTGREVSTVR